MRKFGIVKFKRSHLRFVSMDLAILARVHDNPAVSAIEIANAFTAEEKLRQRQRKGYQAVKYGAMRGSVQRLKLMGLIVEGDPYDPTGRMRETGLKQPGKRIPLYISKTGKQVLKDHLRDIAGVEL